jgi:uncharacterized protein DUF4124
VDLQDRLSTKNLRRRNLLLRSGIEGWPGLLASIMHPHFPRASLAAILVLATPVALADVYTWKDPAGRLNVSNVAPPEGVRIESVVHEDPPKVSPGAAAARAQGAEMRALNERVAQLADEVERAKEQAALPPVVYRPAPSPPVLVNVNVAPAPAAAAPGYADYSPAYPYAYSYPGYPYPGYPGLPRDYCEPTVFGCPLYGFPVGAVVVVNGSHSHGMKHFERMRGGLPQAGMRPMPMPMPARARFGPR